MKSCRIWPSPTENREKSFACVLSCSDIPHPLLFSSDICSFFLEKRFPARMLIFFFFFMVRNKILLVLRLASCIRQQKSALQRAG